MVLPLLLGLGIQLAKEFIPDIIGSIAGSKGEAIAERVVGLAEGITGETEPDSVMRALRANPDMVLKLQMELAVERREAAKYEYLDRESARRMSTKSDLHAWAGIIVSILVTVGFAGMLWAVIAQPIPEASSAIAYVMVGALQIAFGQVVNFWLGSSRGSQEKSHMLLNATKR
jgi:hypothetical protein